MDQIELTLVVMAAGIGSRYGGLKQIDSIGPSGEIILDYSVYDALQAGFTKVVLVISKANEKAIHELVGRNIAKHCDLIYVYQRMDDLPARFRIPAARVKPWGTGHAVLACRNVVNSPFAVINADDFYGQSAYQTLASSLFAAQDKRGVADYYMIGYHLGNTLTENGFVARGVCSVDSSGDLLNVIEHTHIERKDTFARYTEDGQHWTKLPFETIVSMNFWGFTPSIFTALSERFIVFLESNQENLDNVEYFLPNVVGELVQEKKVRVSVMTTQEKWHGMTYQQDKVTVKSAIQELIHQGVYPEDLWAGSK